MCCGTPFMKKAGEGRKAPPARITILLLMSYLAPLVATAPPAW
jgi:hypothetical protein